MCPLFQFINPRWFNVRGVFIFACAVVFGLIFFAPKTKAATIYSDTATGSFTLANAQLFPNITATSGKISTIKVYLKRDPQNPWYWEWPTNWKPGMVLYDDVYSTYCGYGDKTYEEIGSDWTLVTFTYYNKLDLSKHRLYFADSYYDANWYGCGSGDVSGRVLIQADGANKWTVEINTDSSDFILSFTSPAAGSPVTVDQDFQVSGTCPNIGTAQLALTTNSDYILPENKDLVNYSIDCVNNAWSATTTITQFDKGLYIIDKQSGSNVFLPLMVKRPPVLIIPGIMGTELYNEDALIWPNLSRMLGDVNDQFLTENLSLDGEGNSINNITTGDIIREVSVLRYSKDFFKGLINSLESAHYQAEESYFVFPYDWRLNLEDSKIKLQQKIDYIKNYTGSSKVDVIAHSMGGLLVEDYINSFGKDNINKLIFIGTPHLGAPKAGKVLVDGDRFGIPWLEEDRIRDLALNSPSIHELLPSPTYFTEYQGYIKPYKFLANSPFYNYQETKNFYLDKKNKNPIMFQQAENFWNKNLENLDYNGIDTYNITGCKTATQAGYQLAVGNNIIGMVGRTSGDGTVPMVSAQYINIDPNHKFYVKDADHSSLPSADGAMELITGILDGNIPSLANNVSNSSTFCNFKGKALSWYSPVEVHIYMGNKHTGPIENGGIEYGIPGVDYDIMGGDMVHGEKFIFLPTDEGQQYQVVAKGLDTGTFDYKISEIDNGQYLFTQVFNDIPVNTSTQAGMNVTEASLDNTLNLNINGQTQEIQASAKLVGDQATDLIPPETKITVTGTEGKNGWYIGDVDINLDATDNNSGVMEIKYSLDNGQTYQNYASPFKLVGEGEQKVSYYAIDKAGNDEKANIYSVKIDKTPPEIKASFNVGAKDFVFGVVDNLDLNATMVCSSKSCEAKDAAGNSTVLKFAKTKALFWYLLDLDSVSYNGVKASLKDNLFWVKFVNQQDILKDLNQTMVIKNQEIARIDYNKNKDESKIVNFTKKEDKQKYSLLGMHYIEILTNQNKLNINIK
jgi:hypothetical protein